MNSDVSAARLDVALEIVLLCVVEYVAGRVEPDDCAIAREVLLRECAGVFGCVDGKAVFLSELFDGGDPDADGAMSEPSGFGEDEYARLGASATGTQSEASARASETKRCIGDPDDGVTAGRTATRQFAPRSRRWTEAAPAGGWEHNYWLARRE